MRLDEDTLGSSETRRKAQGKKYYGERRVGGIGNWSTIMMGPDVKSLIWRKQDNKNSLQSDLIRLVLQLYQPPANDSWLCRGPSSRVKPPE